MQNRAVYKPTISIVMITKNEERNIHDCLESVRWADEIVMVDAESTDRTVEIAQQYTGKIFVRPWPGFGAQKNFGIEQASSDWILIVDADERVSPELCWEIQGRVKQWAPEAPVAYRIPRRNFYYGRWVRHGGIYPDYQTRLFQRGKACYNNIHIHENLLIDGKVGTLDGHLDHYTERRIEDHFKKFNLYTTLAAREKQRSRHEVHWYDLIFNPLVIFVKSYLLKQGFRDGIRGMIISVFASMYTFVKYVKLWEIIQKEKDNEQET